MARDRFDKDDYDDYDDRRPRRRERDDRDEDDEDPRRRDDDGPVNTPASMALLLGILSFVGGLTAIPGLICGFIGLNKASKLGGAGKGTAATGTALSGVGVIVLGLTIWLVIWWMGGQSETRSRQIASDNLRQIGLAMHNFHDVHGQLTSGIEQSRMGGFGGRPMRDSELSSKLSWRVEMLPYIEQDNLYRAFNTDEPWDSGTNRPHSNTLLMPYVDPSTPADPKTRWRVFYGEGAAFDPARQQRGRSLVSITDGVSNTIMVAESGQKVTWTQFDEMKFDQRNPPDPNAMGQDKSPTFQVLMFDGSVKNVKKTISRGTFRDLITPAGGEVLGFDWDDDDAPRRRGRW